MKNKTRNILLSFWALAPIVLISVGCSAISSVAKNQEGLRQYNQNRYEDAARTFQDAVRIDQTNADAHYNLASAYHQLGVMYNDPSRLQLAESEYDRCLEYSDYNHPECYRGLSNLMEQTGRFDDGVQLLRHWAEQHPTAVEPRIQLAYFYDKANRTDVAEDYLLQAYTMQQNNPRVLAALGYLREREGKSDQAIFNYQQSLAANPDQPSISERLAALQTRSAM